MAEFDALDELLSGSLKRAAQPGDSTGVADAIRARVAAGDAGTPAPSGSAPGFGGGLGWLPWVGAIVVLGLVGGALGVAGAFGHPTDVVLQSALSVPASGVSAASCPGANGTVPLAGGEHVYAVLRTADSGFIGLRDPSDVSTTVWVPSSALVKADFSSLPIGGCGTPSIVPVPVVVAPPVVTPGKPTKPGAPKDTTAPTVGTPTADNTANLNCHARVTVTASDNIGVSSVSISWTGTNHGSGNMSATGGHWEYQFQGDMSNTFSGSTTFTVVAHDAAGNASSPKSSAPFFITCIG
jgi:hypothetical protein